MLALIERATEVITAVQSRNHTALGRELTILAEIIKDCTPGVYDYDPVGAPRTAKQDDYAQQLSIVPVSDPASATMAARAVTTGRHPARNASTAATNGMVPYIRRLGAAISAAPGTMKKSSP